MRDRCANCGISCNARPLFRVNPMGELPAVWACKPCIDGGLITPAELPDPETERVVNIIAGLE